MARVSFATGLVAGIVATVLAGFFVFRARAVAGQASGRRFDLRAFTALLALVIALIALIRSGDSGDGSQTTTRPDATDPAASSGPTSSAPTSSGPATSAPALVSVPNVVGLTQANATAQMQSAGLRVSVQTLPSRSIPSGYVVSQTPNALSSTTANAVVILTVSARP
jgi:hypothetical protein